MITPLEFSPLAGTGARYLEVRTILDWPGRPLVSARLETADGNTYGTIAFHEDVAVHQLAYTARRNK